MYYLACTSTFLDSGGTKVLILSWQNCNNSPSHRPAMGRGLRRLRAKAQAQQMLLPKAAPGFVNRQFCFLFFYRCNTMYTLLLFCFQDQLIPFQFHWNYFFGSSLFSRRAFALNLSFWPDVFLFFSVSPNTYSVMSLYTIVFSAD